jgi:hypothetical protein
MVLLRRRPAAAIVVDEEIALPLPQQTRGVGFARAAPKRGPLLVFESYDWSDNVLFGDGISSGRTIPDAAAERRYINHCRIDGVRHDPVSILEVEAAKAAPREAGIG